MSIHFIDRGIFFYVQNVTVIFILLLGIKKGTHVENATIDSTRSTSIESSDSVLRSRWIWFGNV